VGGGGENGYPAAAEFSARIIYIYIYTLHCAPARGRYGIVARTRRARVIYLSAIRGHTRGGARGARPRGLIPRLRARRIGVRESAIC